MPTAGLCGCHSVLTGKRRATSEASECGRWLGNPTADEGLVTVKCWDDSKSILIVVADSCPCIVKDANDTITGSNPPCCGDIYHM